MWRQKLEEEEATREAAEAEKRKLKILQRPKATQEKLKPKVRLQADIQESLKHRQKTYDSLSFSRDPSLMCVGVHGS